MFSLTLGLLSAILCTVIASYHSNSVGVTQYRHVMANIYTLLHELVCNTVSCATLRGRIKDDARSLSKIDYSRALTHPPQCFNQVLLCFN